MPATYSFCTYRHNIARRHLRSAYSWVQGVPGGRPASAHAPNAPRGSPGAHTRGGGTPAASASSSSRSHAPVDASAAACFAALVDASKASPPGGGRGAGTVLASNKQRHLLAVKEGAFS